MLARAPDVARALSRLSLQRGGPRDLGNIRAALAAAREIVALLSRAQRRRRSSRRRSRRSPPAMANWSAPSQRALAADPPLDKRAGNFIAQGFDAELDEARALRDESRRVIASLQQRYVELAETKQLKIKHNNFLGFFIEVPQAQGERLLRPPFDTLFTHRQTMQDAMRFSTRELAELEAKIASAADRAQERELALFEELAGAVLDARAGAAAIGASFRRARCLRGARRAGGQARLDAPACRFLARFRDRRRTSSRRRGLAGSARKALRRQ